MLSHSLRQQNGSWSVSSVELLKQGRPTSHYGKMFRYAKPEVADFTCEDPGSLCICAEEHYTHFSLETD